MKLRDQLEALEKETAAKLAEMDQYNKDMQVGIIKHSIVNMVLVLTTFHI